MATEQGTPIALEDIYAACEEATKYLRDLTDKEVLKTEITGCLDSETDSNLRGVYFVTSDGTDFRAEKLSKGKFPKLWLTEEIYRSLSGDNAWEAAMKYNGKTRKIDDLKSLFHEKGSSVYEELYSHINGLIQGQVRFYVKVFKKPEKENKVLSEFKHFMLTRIYEGHPSPDEDSRIAGTDFETVLLDEKGDAVKKLALLTIVSLFREGEMDFQSLYKHIFPSTENSHVKSNIPKKEIWERGKAWFKKAKTERFLNLDIVETILPNTDPNGKREEFPAYVKAEDKMVPLMEKLEETSNHLYLIGEGGIGKTTSLAHIMETEYKKEYSEATKVPLFVELSKAPDTYEDINHIRHYENGKCTFIRNTVAMQLGISLKEVDTLFREESKGGESEYWLLLDGLNEVSKANVTRTYIEDGKECQDTMESVIRLVMCEIQTLIDSCHNVRVIITSRYEETTESIQKIYLAGVTQEGIKKYLEKQEVKQARIDVLESNRNLLEILRIPLFLTMYAKLEGDEEILSGGEILHLFFHQKAESLYTEQKRQQEVEKEVKKTTGSLPPKRITAEMLQFMLDFILPELAWQMVKDEEFHIGSDRYRDSIWKVLAEDDDTSICGEYGCAAFEKEFTDDISEIASSICERLNKHKKNSEKSITDGVMKQIVETLGIMRLEKDNGEDEEKYAFVHQHVRDYFAAKYHINRLKFAWFLFVKKKDGFARACLDEWKEEPLPTQVLVFIGEALGEKHNAPRFVDEKNEWEYTVPDPDEKKCERNLIKRSFDIYRNRFEGEDGYAVWNLLQILKIVRGDLSGEDFSYLDLTNCAFNSYRLSNSTYSVNMTGTRIDDRLFSPNGHSNSILYVQYSPDGQYIVTSSSDGKAKVWNSRLFQVIGTMDDNRGAVKMAQYSFDGQLIISISDKNIFGHGVETYCRATIWYAPTLEKVGVIDERSYRIVNDDDLCMFDPLNRYKLTVVSGNRIRVCDKIMGSEVAMLDGHTNKISCIRFSCDGKRVISTSLDGTAIIWDMDNFQRVGTVDEGNGLDSARFSPDRRFIVTVSLDHKIVNIWNTHQMTRIGKLDGHDGGISFVRFSMDGEYVITASPDKTAILWRTKTCEIVGVFRGHLNGLISAQFCYDRKHVITSSWDGSIILWDKDSFEIVGEYNCKQIKWRRWQSFGLFSPNEEYYISCEGCHHNDPIIVWDVIKEKEIGRLGAREDSDYGFRSATISPDGFRIVTSGDEEIVWDAKSLNIIGICQSPERLGRAGRNCDVQFSPDGMYIAMGYSSGYVQIWDAQSLNRIIYFKAHDSCINSVAFDPSGTKLLTACYSGELKEWDFLTGENLNCVSATMQRFVDAYYCENGRSVVTITEDGSKKQWDTNTYRLIAANEGAEQLKPDRKEIPFMKRRSVSVYTEGLEKIERLLVASKDRLKWAEYNENKTKVITGSEKSRKVIVWDTKSLKQIGTLWPGIERAVFTPNGDYILAVLNSDIVVLDGKTFAVIRPLFEDFPYCHVWMDFSSDGKYVVLSCWPKNDHVLIMEKDQKTLLLDTNELSFIGVFDGIYCDITSSSEGDHLVTIRKDKKQLIVRNVMRGEECVCTIPAIAGINVEGVDLRAIRGDSKISERMRLLLWRYGADIETYDEEGKKD